MRPIHCLVMLATLVGVLWTNQSNAQPSARSLDRLLQDYAYRAFVRPHTGVPYEGKVPSNFTGIKISVLRLRSGSLRTRGVPSYKEFRIPPGIIVQPYVERLTLVYQNLGNWSSNYYSLPGYTHLTPVLGLLAYNAANLSGIDLPELGIVVSSTPILINFTNVTPVPNGLAAKCVWFDLDGLPELRDMVSSDACSTYRQGHFSIVVNSTGFVPVPAPGPSEIPSKNSNVWKIVVGVIGGLIALLLFAWLLVCLIRYRKERKVAEMERHADVGEALRTARVGDTEAPVASVTRTMPALENEYVA